MDRTQVKESHRTWQNLLSNWGSLDRRLFDHPTKRELMNLDAYLKGIEGSISHHFGILEFVLGFYGDANWYMSKKKNDDRRLDDYFCSQTNLITFRKGVYHFKEPEIEDLERLLRHYLLDTEHQQEIDAKPLQTT
ncbi:MAG: hypothetical protein Q8R04_03485 [Nanoarchaeota archaeon]|nr:hypothetical protein [Nanoarchaeota archaeon]